MKVLLLGDIMPSGDRSGKPIVVSKRLNKYLLSFDFKVATFESALGKYEDIDETKQPKSEVAVWSKKEDLFKLTDLGINVVSLANNHACDCGIDRMLNLRDELSAIGIKTIGAGRNIKEAMQPVILEKDGETLALIGVCEDNPNSLGTLRFATESQGGIYKYDEYRIIEQIKQLKTKFNYVGVVIHWGVEHKWLPELFDVEVGNKMIDAGADMIIGGHPHHIQPMVFYKNKPVYYSLGNFCFPDFCLDKISNVFYPNKDEIEKLPVFSWMAPDRRNFAMLYHWKYYARLGMIGFVELQNGRIRANKCFGKYCKGKLSFSSLGSVHAVVLRLFSLFVGKPSSPKINFRITILKSIIENKVLSLFCKRYRFYQYLKNHND